MLMSMGKIFGTAKKRSPWPGGLLEEVVAMAGLTVSQQLCQAGNVLGLICKCENPL